ncbi:hypothetical protein [Niabella sp.]|uniref:hypothetical protein n=1 Tax=Niabella sp. TaxID=1962976 RepID=UPI00263057D4|nr:hypothetical protein [Niabella sp.]
MFLLRRYSSEFRVEWDDFIERSKNGLFFFKTDYLFYHSDRFIDHSLLVFNEHKELCAVFPANENKAIIYSHQGLTFGSLILSYKTKAKDVLLIFEEIIRYYRTLGFERIIYKQIPYHFNKYPSQEDAYALFRNDAVLFRRDISSVIKLSERLGFSPAKKNLVNKCMRIGLNVAEKQDFSIYWSLLESVLSKFHTTPVHTLVEIQRLKNQYPNEIRLFETWHSGVLLAGVVIFDFGSSVHTQYMANSSEGRKIGALDFLIYHLINNVFMDKDFFSFGISNENDGRYLNEGLIQQKELLGARGACLDFYELNL